MARILLVVSGLLLCPCMRAEAWTNLLENGGLEADADTNGVADTWSPNVHAGAEGDFALDEKEKTGGSASQKIIHLSDNNVWVRISQMPIPCRPEVTYRFDCDVKSTCQYNLLVYEFTSESDYKTHGIASGTAPEWQRKGGTIRTSKAAKSFKVSLIVQSKGEAWFDNVSLIALDEVPSVVVPPAGKPPKIDGRLDDACWARAARIEPFFLLGGGGALAKERTIAMICQDDANLYVAFKCKESDPQQIQAKHREHDAPIHSDDCVEVFLDPGRTGKTYYHVSVNTLGTMYDRKHEPVSAQPKYNLHWYGPGMAATVPRQKVVAAPPPKWDPRWQAKVVVNEREWRAEMAIPFSGIGVKPSLGEMWGANFCRERKVEGEENSCWALLDGDTFHSPNQFGMLIFGGGSVSAPKEISTPKAERIDPAIVPWPQRLTWEDRDFELERVLKCGWPKKSEALMKGLDLLRDDLHQRFGIELKTLSTTGGTTGVFFVDHEPLSDTGKKLLQETGLTLPADEEGYVLVVGATQVVLIGRSARGSFNGIQTLRQLAAELGDKRYFRGVKISDYPDMQFRGWHSMSPTQTMVDDYKQFMDLLALLKFNAVMLEVNNRLHYESHPDIAYPDALTKEELRALVEYARSLRLEVIPQVQTLGHFSYVLNKPAYKHLSEHAEPIKRRGFWTYCPSNPQVYPLVFDLFTEVIEVFKPKRYFHIGHDEFTFAPFGVCERCKASPPEKLFADEVTKLHNWLVKRKLRTLMWGDQLLEDHHGGPPYNTYKATPLIPKDIVICDWHYRPWEEFPSLRYFKENGFETIACGWYNVQNVYNFSHAAVEVGNMGYSGTTWHSINYIAVRPELMSAVIMTAENAWTNWKPKREEMTYHPTDRFTELYNLRKEPPHPKAHFVCDLDGWCTADLDGSDGDTGCLALGKENDLSSLPRGLQRMGGIPFHIGDRAIALAAASTDGALPANAWQIAVGSKAKSLLFLHTTTRPPTTTDHVYHRRKQEPKRVGRYIVYFDDGSREEIVLDYRRVITHWNNRLGTSDAAIVWCGHTRAGSLIQLCAYEWKNPRPDVNIRTIDFRSALSGVRPILIALSGSR